VITGRPGGEKRPRGPGGTREQSRAAGRGPTSGRRGRRLAGLTIAALALVALVLAGCGTSVGASSPGVINAIGAESQYANVISQIGGNYVHASSILNNPNTDPHSFESSPSVAREVAGAELIVQNGLGYDDFMSKIESATSGSSRHLLVVQHLLKLPNSTPNPHLWYDPTTMPVVAQAIATELSNIQPKDAGYFVANLKKFDASLTPWFDAIAAFKARYNNTPVATTEPVADYLLQAMGADNLTPFTFQADIMNGTDPTPQDISLESSLFGKHQVKVFCYNQQVVDALTSSIRQNAKNHGVPVVGVYETMPVPGYNYQSWMLAETQAIQKAVAAAVSTEHL
jgi:zinc/manganese transport system substrate-binding protein